MKRVSGDAASTNECLGCNRRRYIRAATALLSISHTHYLSGSNYYVYVMADLLNGK